MNIRDRMAGLAPLQKTVVSSMAVLILLALAMWLMGEDPRSYAVIGGALAFAGAMYWRIFRHGK